MSTLEQRPSVGQTELSPARRKPSLAGFWIAGLVAVAGILGALVWAGFGTFATVTAADDFARATLPASLTVEVAEPGTLVVYYEGEPVPSSADLGLDVTGPGDAAVPVGSYPVELRYDSPTQPGVMGEAVARFTADAPGSYTVASSYDPQGTASLAVGEDVARGFVGRMAGPVLLLLGSLLAATVLIVVTILRRTRP